MPDQKSKLTKFYLTKHALTTGIYEIEAELVTGHPNLLREHVTHGCRIHRKPHWHDSREQAVKYAESMQTARIASLKRQIAKLEKLDWSKP